MKALSTILAASLVFAQGAYAADNQQSGASSSAVTVAAAPVAGSAAAASAAAAAPVRAAAPQGRSRAEVKAEAVEAVKHHKTALAEQLAYYR